MSQSIATRASASLTSPASLATVVAMARLARQTCAVVHVLVPRAPGVVERARQEAQWRRLAVEVDLMAHTIRVRFSPSP